MYSSSSFLDSRSHLGCGVAVGDFDPSGLVVDAARGRVYAAGGEARFRSGAKPLVLLGALTASPEGASKEALNRRVWGTDDYHPLRHDNRLRVAARKLRQRVEPLLEGPLIDTLEDGYVLKAPVRWLAP